MTNPSLARTPRLQRYFTSTLTAHRLVQFNASLDRNYRSPTITIHDQVRLKCMNTSIAGSFLRAWPRDERKISNQDFIIILRVRLGLPPIQAPCLGEIKCICSGQPILDEEGEHLFVRIYCGRASLDAKD